MDVVDRVFGSARGPSSSDLGGAHIAVGGTVRLLAEVRLVIVALALGVAVVGDGLDVWQVAVVLLALPFSFVPARSWERRGALLSRSGILLACDLAATSVLLAVLTSELLLVYVAATVALLGLVVGWRLALFMSAPLVLVVVSTRWTQMPPLHTTLVVVGGLGAVAAMAWAGDSLGGVLRHQAAVAHDLSLTRARRARTLERVRIARDLHDTVAGDLAGATMLAGALVTRLRKDGAQGRALHLARQLEETCQLAHAHTRVALGELRRAEVPPVDDVLDVCGRWSERTGLPCEVDVDPAFGETALDVVSDVRAVLLELLENVRRHSGASRVVVTVGVGDGTVRLVVEDDGRGMPAGVPAPGHAATAGSDHFGLTGIDERAGRHGGEVRRTVPPGGGLRTTVVLPLGTAPDTPGTRERVDQL